MRGAVREGSTPVLGPIRRRAPHTPPWVLVIGPTRAAQAAAQAP
jgi:hypothetical protein